MKKIMLRGYMPKNSFGFFEKCNEVSPYWGETKEILGERISDFIYAQDTKAFKSIPYLIDALENAKGHLGIKIAKELRKLIPDKQRNYIVCKDVNDKNEIPKTENQLSLEDERYYVVLQDKGEDDKGVQMYLYRKCS